MSKKIILSVHPWTAAGPGWASNHGLTVRWVRRGTEGEDTIQGRDMTHDEALLFAPANVLMGALRQAVARRSGYTEAP